MPLKTCSSSIALALPCQVFQFLFYPFAWPSFVQFFMELLARFSSGQGLVRWYYKPPCAGGHWSSSFSIVLSSHGRLAVFASQSFFILLWLNGSRSGEVWHVGAVLVHLKSYEIRRCVSLCLACLTRFGTWLELAPFSVQFAYVALIRDILLHSIWVVIFSLVQNLFIDSGQVVDASEVILSFHYIYAKDTR